MSPLTSRTVTAIAALFAAALALFGAWAALRAGLPPAVGAIPVVLGGVCCCCSAPRPPTTPRVGSPGSRPTARRPSSSSTSSSRT